MPSPPPPIADAADPSWPDALLALLLSTDTFEGFLHELTVLTVAALPAGSMCGVTVIRQGHPATVASSDELTAAIDQIQYRTEQGPCLHTTSTGQPHYVSDTATEERWPDFCSEALARGVHSCLSLPLIGPAGTVGGYNLYNFHIDAFGTDDRNRIRVFSGNAAGAVSLALRLSDQSSVNADLHATLATRSVIDQAIGIMMAQQRCPPRDAFAILSHASQNRNMKVRDLAAQIVTTVGGGPSGFDPDTFQPPG